MGWGESGALIKLQHRLPSDIACVHAPRYHIVKTVRLYSANNGISAMKLSSSFRSGFAAGLRSPFAIWRGFSGSTKANVALRHGDTVARARAQTGRMLREAERYEGQRLEQTKEVHTAKPKGTIAA